ncbi:hypothetical protein KAM338_29010 [Aeromonas caviae]|uniref:hypothetical protein n=1 Tax=Aeromonas hydrophila TaxID=644 RepID=UPI0018607C97|nr:hypothetical protein [Aeromonas hydrophila]BCK63763.1 hypothetical protein KAM330_27520 [Aeromonas hydrophila]GKQ62724.1 hypothetical protein KAM338_29010 [Aeromonas caviae]
MVILLLLWRAEGYHQSAVGHLSPFIHECRTYYLNSRFNRDFRILNPALTALRNGAYYQFEDLSPMLILESVASGHEVAQQVQPQSGTHLLQGDVKLSNKSQKIDVKQQKTLEQLSPELLLGQLGYHLDTGKPK